MGIISVLVVGSVIGLGIFLFWILTGLNFKYSGLIGSVMQGVIILPFLAIGGICAFFLFGHLMGDHSVGLLDGSGLQDILIMAGGAAAIAGIPLGLAGYFIGKFSP